MLGLLEAIAPGELLSMRAQLLMAFSPKQHLPMYAKNCFERNPGNGPLPCAAIVQASVAAVNTGTTVEEGNHHQEHSEEAEAETFRRVTNIDFSENKNRKPVEINLNNTGKLGSIVGTRFWSAPVRTLLSAQLPPLYSWKILEIWHERKRDVLCEAACILSRPLSWTSRDLRLPLDASLLCARASSVRIVCPFVKNMRSQLRDEAAGTAVSIFSIDFPLHRL